VGNKGALFRRFAWIALTLAGLSVLAAGCGSRDSLRRFAGWENAYAGGDYPEAVERWTRESRIYRGLELELLAHATYKSKAFRKAYLAEFARVFGQDPDRLHALTRQEAEAEKAGYEFMIAAYDPDTKRNDFDKGNASWRIYLVTDAGAPMTPVDIRRVKTDSTLRHFFPYVSPWKSLYAVRFPKAAVEMETMLQLTITGVAGRIEMQWPVALSEKAAP